MRITDQNTIDQYYQALIDKDPDYLGVFFVGVTTTLIFCVSTCHARKPKRENVIFYTRVKEALENGFRPCKLCKPTENAHQPPADVEKAIQLATANPKVKITDAELTQHGISPSAVRRWFKQHYGMTYHAFARMVRINSAYEELQHGKTATDTAFSSGYESLSGFGYTYKKLTGNAPSRSDTQDVLLITRITTPLGPMFVCATEKGICLLEFTNRKMLETELQDLQKRHNAPILMGENTHIKQLQRELDEYFSGKRQRFDVALDPVGTEFQQRVWQVLRDIPYGETWRYLDQANALGNPKAVRAVANANGCNKIAIIIPCHRVIGSDGSLTGYGGGLERKKWLLDLEQANVNNAT